MRKLTTALCLMTLVSCNATDTTKTNDQSSVINQPTSSIIAVIDCETVCSALCQHEDVLQPTEEIVCAEE